MKNDFKLIFEAYSSKFASEKPVTNHLISQLRLMHDRLNEMSTAISLSRSPEIDQLLSHIRDLADMLITEQPNNNEDAEMPEKDFIKLKQHINKGPIQVKNNSKELPYTHKYIHHLAKQDSREGQKEENAEGLCIEDLAAKHGVSLEQLQKQLEMGLKVETEHTEDMDVAKKIALDHLNEDPEYYTKLAKMEGNEENAEKYVYDNIEVAFNLNGREYIAYGDVHFGQEDLHGKEEDTVENFGVIDATTKQEVQDDAVIRHGYNAVYNAGVNQSAEENEERRIDPKCWKGYHKQGTKLKNGVRVNNCVKNK